MSLGAESLVTISAAVVALTQILKWGGVSDRRGPLIVLALSLLGVILYQISFAPDDVPILARRDLWPIFSAWIVVATSAAGVFGFTRAGPDAVTATKSPPSGAGNSPTVKADGGIG